MSHHSGPAQSGSLFGPSPIWLITRASHCGPLRAQPNMAFNRVQTNLAHYWAQLLAQPNLPYHSGPAQYGVLLWPNPVWWITGPNPVLAHCCRAAEKGYHRALIGKREDTIKNCYLRGTSTQMGCAWILIGWVDQARASTLTSGLNEVLPSNAYIGGQSWPSQLHDGYCFRWVANYAWPSQLHLFFWRVLLVARGGSGMDLVRLMAIDHILYW